MAQVAGNTNLNHPGKVMMRDIESSGYPLVYKAGMKAAVPPGLDVQADNIAVRAEVCALTGMQKEALVYYGPTGTVWRMVSDEGPYLNGTDLAPFPLAFYTTGMALSFTEEVLKQAKAAGIALKQVQLTQDNFYTMAGSALQGDMIGGALPVKMTVEMEADASPETICRIVELAEQSSPAQVYMRETLANTFALAHNGAATPVTNVAPSPAELRQEPTPHLQAARPLSDDTYLSDIICKEKAAEALSGVEGGAGSSLQATQKRTLHVRGICTVRPDGLKEVLVQLFKPLGSTFRFFGDDSQQERAPAGLAYLAAGIGFCFMTQIGRYAHIVKQDLRGYSIVQDTIYKIGPDSAAAYPVDTHTFLETGEDDDAAQRTLYMSERTCFLHAAMRGSNKTQISVVLNGTPL
jgi:uncharacterized OsmC-like protein